MARRKKAKASFKLQPHGASYRIIFTAAGKQRFHRIGKIKEFASEREAQRRAEELFPSIRAEAEEQAARLAKGHLFTEYFKHYLDVGAAVGLRGKKPHRPSTTASYQKMAVAHFHRWEYLEELTAKAIRDFIVERLTTTSKKTGKPIKPKTLRKELYCLTGLLNLAKDEEVLPDVPHYVAPALRDDYVAVEMTEEDVEALIEELPDRYTRQGGTASGKPIKEYVTLLWETMLRHATVSRMRWEHIKWRESRLWIPEENDKKGWARKVVLTPRALATLRAMRKDAPAVAGRVFRGACDYRGTMRSAACRAGLDNDICFRVSDHAFRHARATWMGQRTTNLLGMQHAGGWRTLEAMQKYLKPSVEMSARMYADLGLCQNAMPKSSASR